MKKAIREAAGEGTEFIDASGLATALFGDSIATNLFMLGHAWQKGLIPLSLESIMRAIELNDVSIELNKTVFAWGRLAAHDPARVESQARPTAKTGETKPQRLPELLARRVSFLTDYQDAAYAERYRGIVEEVASAERTSIPGRTILAETVARGLFKLMAYKDEYEVARLYTNGDFLRKLNAQFEGDFRLEFHLAPPLLASRHPGNGHLIKQRYGQWMLRGFGLLAKLKGLRGSKFDIFGYTVERRTERQLIEDYVAMLRDIVPALSADNHAIAVQLAALPEQIRGFGHVKEKNLEQARTRWKTLLAEYSDRLTWKGAA